MNSFIALSRIGLLSLCATSIATADNPVAVAEAVASGLVKVEFHLQYDKGEAPQAQGWSERCPNCGQFHSSDSSEVVEQERPLEVAGFVLSPTQVLTADPLLHPRFLKEIRIVDGEGTIPAKVSAIASRQNAIILELTRALEHAKPLEFNVEAEQPYMAVTYSNANGEWMLNVQPAKPGITISDRRQFITLPSKCLITDATGIPVAISMNEAVPAEAGWKGSPLEWEVLSVEQQEKRLADLRSTTDNGLLRTTLHLRSPRRSDAEGMSARFFGQDEEESPTIRHSNAVLVDPTQLVVLAELEPSETARLESIDVHLPAGDTVSATFSHSLRDYGVLVAKLNEPLNGPLQLSKGDIRGHRDQILWAADVALQGENRVAYYDHRRIASYETGWRRHIYPQVPGESENLFLFDDEMNLVALPFKRRPLPATEESWTSEDSSILTAAADLIPVLADVVAHSDPGNVPLSEQDEARLAWLGVELQELTPELARINKVAHLTDDGSTGALVTYVYPDSPAAKAGIEVGHVLLRMHVDARPQPIDVTVDSYMFAEQPFPWDQLDEAPEQVFDQIPQPWPPAETTIARALTDLGFGTKFVLETAADGQVVSKDFVVEQSPDHFDSADRFESKALGLTVRDMTYEVRRYFHRETDEPGVVISKIEVGSHASKAGLKPYEFITHVNDQPVPDVATFERLTSGGGDLRLQVRRMTRGRLVKVTLDAAEPPATQPADEQTGDD